MNAKAPDRQTVEKRLYRAEMLPPGYVTPAEYARRHGISYGRVYDQIHMKRLPYIRVGGYCFVRLDEAPNILSPIASVRARARAR